MFTQLTIKLVFGNTTKLLKNDGNLKLENIKNYNILTAFSL